MPINPNREKFVFSFVKNTPPPTSARDFVAFTNKVSKTTAKHDRKAAHYCRNKGIKPKVLDVTGLFSAGLVSRF